MSIIEKLKKENKYIILGLIPENGEISNYLDKLEIRYFISNYKWIMHKKNIKWYLKKIIIPIFNFFSFLKIYQKLKKEEIKLIYTNTSVINIGFYLSKKIKCKHIYHIREFGKEDHGLEYIYSLKYMREKLNSKNTKLIAISNSLKNKYEKLLLNKNIELIYNGIENDFLKKDYKKNEIIKFILIGNIIDGKNQLEVIKAAKQLINKGIENFNISLIGREDKKYKEILDIYISKNHLEKKIIFLGVKSKEDIKKIIKNSDAGLMSSLKEAFGRVTIEYMMGGLPVIASNTGANTELIKDDINGYLYCLGNVSQLSEKMKYLIENQFKIEELGKNGKEIAMKNYTSDINYINIKKEIEKII